VFNRKLLRDSFLATVFIFALILFFLKVSQIDKLFSLFDPVSQALGDVELTDLTFSELRQPEPVNLDSIDIVLVNIGNLNRAQIAAELNLINSYQPKVVGLDVYFEDLKSDTLGDLLLADALSKTKNLVMYSKGINLVGDEDVMEKLEVSHPLFRYGETGATNLFTNAQEQHQFKVCRTFPPVLNINGKKEYAFGVKIVQKYDSAKAVKFLKFSKRDEEVINYTSNIQMYGESKIGVKFLTLDVDDVFKENFTPDIIKGRIVIFGFMGESFDDTDWEDKFYTPMNKHFAGRSNPDMYGVVIHANIVQMLLDENYIGYQGKFSAVMTAILLGFLNVWFFSWIYWSLPLWYDGITKIIQLFELFLIVLINIFVFHWFSYKTELTLAAACVALAGDSLEVYYGLLVNIFSKNGRKELFKIHRIVKKAKRS